MVTTTTFDFSLTGLFFRICCRLGQVCDRLSQVCRRLGQVPKSVPLETVVDIHLIDWMILN